MVDDPKRLVTRSYDRIVDTYLERFGTSAVRAEWLAYLMKSLPIRAGRVLDLGCGAGIPVASALAEAGHSVVGVDSSMAQIARARKMAPKAAFIQADMTKLRFDRESFDAVGAFYSITHLPAGEQGALFGAIERWLKPGGIFVASLGSGGAGDWTGEWLGTPMFFSHNGEQESLALLRAAGFEIVRSEVQKQDNEEASFLWVAAVKPARPDQ